ncbi:MAG: twin-arginine translocation signal domain-containing protein [Planctomycetota bacterium]|jgi:hypothetical protein
MHPTQISRRRLLKAAAVGVGAAAVGLRAGEGLSACSTPKNPAPDRKLIVVLFGGGTRSSESIDDPQHRYIPRLWNRMVPHGTLFTNMRVEHKVVHPNSTGSIMTGHWEWDDIDWSRPVANPTIFEIYRKAQRAPDAKAWAFVYASILANAGRSLSPDYGAKYAANVVVPPTIPRTAVKEMESRLAKAAEIGSTEAETRAAADCSEIARKQSRISLEGLQSEHAKDFINAQYEEWKRGLAGTSHDRFLAERAVACMKKFSPDVMTVCFGEIDCAHYGSWSRYVDAIHRTDELTWRIWKAAEQLEDYRGKTLMLVLPDHGRELDREGHWGFIHHSDFYTNKNADEGCRRVWMLAIGPDAKPGKVVDRPLPITAAAATGLEYLDLQPSKDAERSVWSLIKA